MEATQRAQMQLLLRTAYHVAKQEMPFTAYTSILELQRANGLDVGQSRLSDQACRR